MIVKKIMTRVYVNEIDPAIDFYERLLNVKCGLRFVFQQTNLELAGVGNILIIAGTDEALAPFKSTNATFIVDSVAEFKDFLLENGGVIIHDIRQVPTGFNMTVKHNDGCVVEYVEHR
jgi:hypothetical protein